MPGASKRADQVELDVLRREIVEQPPALAEQDGPQLDLDRVEHAGLQAFLRGVGAVQHHVAVAGGCFGLLHACLDAVGDVVDPLDTGSARAVWCVGTKIGTPSWWSPPQ